MTIKSTTGFFAQAFTLAVAALAFAGRSSAAITVVDPNFSVQPYYTHSTSDDIISFDQDASSNLYYMTSSGFPDINVWKSSGGAPSNIYANANNFAGASVVNIGNTVYFNDSNFANTQFVRGYGPLSGVPSTMQLSTTVNSGLYGHLGDLFITGAQSFDGHSQISYSHLAGDGHLTSDPAIQLGDFSAPDKSVSPGPLSFDLAGNLYFAPGFGDLSIYKWSASEVTAAIGDPAGHSLGLTGHQWLDYASRYGQVAGATSMLLGANGNLFVTLTSFSDASVLAEFGTNAGGAFSGDYTTVLSDTSRLGELRDFAGQIYVSSGNQIVQVVPEPMVAWMMAAGLAMLVLGRRRSQPGMRMPLRRSLP